MKNHAQRQLVQQKNTVEQNEGDTYISFRRGGGGGRL